MMRSIEPTRDRVRAPRREQHGAEREHGPEDRQRDLHGGGRQQCVEFERHAGELMHGAQQRGVQPVEAERREHAPDDALIPARERGRAIRREREPVPGQREHDDARREVERIRERHVRQRRRVAGRHRIEDDQPDDERGREPARRPDAIARGVRGERPLDALRERRQRGEQRGRHEHHGELVPGLRAAGRLVREPDQFKRNNEGHQPQTGRMRDMGQGAVALVNMLTKQVDEHRERGRPREPGEAAERMLQR